jgi:hypothetical protein
MRDGRSRVPHDAHRKKVRCVERLHSRLRNEHAHIHFCISRTNAECAPLNDKYEYEPVLCLVTRSRGFGVRRP